MNLEEFYREFYNNEEEIDNCFDDYRILLNFYDCEEYKDNIDIVEKLINKKVIKIKDYRIKIVNFIENEYYLCLYDKYKRISLKKWGLEDKWLRIDELRKVVRIIIREEKLRAFK
jgi:DNA polymerase sigma